MMADRPILFAGPMVRAILDGRKTQTRRVLPIPRTVDREHFDIQSRCIDPDRGVRLTHWSGDHKEAVHARLPFTIGDRLWVRETWNAFAFSQDGDDAWPTKEIPTAEEMREIREAAYRVDVQAVHKESDRARKWFADQPWRPSIHMPRWASRLTLTVTDVRVQRLQEISEEDAKAEGVQWWDWPGYQYCDCDEDDCVWCSHYPALHTPAFRHLWDSLNAKRAPWESNPWVVAYTFTVERENIDSGPIDR